MRAYLAIFRIRFSNSLQYRAAALAGMATQYAWGFMLILSFAAFYKANPAAFPMPFSQTVSYIWMQQSFFSLFAAYFFDADIFEAITSGSISYEMVRPVSLYARWFSQSIAVRTSKAVLRCIPILLTAFLLPEPYRMILPQSMAQLSLFLISMVLAVGVVVAFNMLVYISAFYTLSAAGVRIIAAMIADFLAGAIIPLPFFPKAAERIVSLLPFAAMQNMPLRIYSGNIAGSAAVRGIGLQVFWLLALVGLGRLLMKRALEKVIVQGG